MSDSSKHSEEPKPPKKPPPWYFRFLIELPAGILVFFVALCAGLILTATGRTFITNFALEHLSVPEGYSLQVENLQSPTLGEWRVSNLQFYRQGAPLLAIQNGTLDWSPWRILLGQFQINTLAATGVHIFKEHLPKARSQATTTKVRSLTLKQRLEQLDTRVNKKLQEFGLTMIPVHFKQVDIDSLVIQEGKRKQEWRLSGDFSVGTNNQFLTFSLTGEQRNHPTKLAALISGGLDFQNELSLNINAKWNSRLGRKTVPSHAQFHAKTRLTDQPMLIQISPSTLQLSNEVMEFSGIALAQKDALLLDNIQLRLLQGQAIIRGSITHKTVALEADLMQLNASHYIGQNNYLLHNGSIEVTGPYSDLTFKGHTSASGEIYQQNTNGYTEFTLNQGILHFSNSLAQLGDAQVVADGYYDMRQRFLSLQGTAKDLHLRQLRDFRIKIPEKIDLLVSDVTTQMEIQFPTPSREKGLQLRATGDFNGTIFSIPSDLHGTIDLNLDRITIHDASIDMNGSPVTAQGSVHWRKKNIDLRFFAQDVQPKTLQWLPIAFPTKFSSSLDGEIQVHGSLLRPTITVDAKGPISYHQLKMHTDCNFNTNLKTLILERCDLREITRNNSLQDNGSQEGQSITQKKVSSHSGKIQFKPLTIELKHKLFLTPFTKFVEAFPQVTNLRNQLEFEGQFQGILETDFVQRAKHGPIQLRRSLANIGFFGEAWNQPLYGGMRANALRTDKGLKLQVDSMGIDYGSKSYITLDADLTSKQVQLRMHALANSVDFQTLPFPIMENFTRWPAVLKANTSAIGTLEKPNIKGNIEYTSDIPVINSLGQNTIVPLQVSGVFTQPKNQPLSLDVSVFKHKQLQSEFYLETNGISRELERFVSEDTPPPLTLESKGQMNLANLNLLLTPLFHQFDGFAFWDMKWENSLSGKLAVSQGSYQHLTLGTSLQDIELALTLKDNSIQVDQGSATDGDEGAVLLQGTLAPSDLIPLLPKPDPNTVTAYAPETNLALSLKDVKLINRPDIETLATGSMLLVPTIGENRATPVTLAGGLKLQPLEIQLDRTQTTAIPELEVIKYNSKFSNPDTVKKPRVPVALDLSLRTDQQAFLRGKGINAELKGNIIVRGTMSEPRVSGFFNTIRGEADILGKRFNIQTGELRFEDYQGLLRLEATHSKVNQDFTARVTGGLDNLDVTLESDPPLPEDETLSQLLFGKSLDDITAVQALRIAAAIQSLSTQGAGLDPIASTRDLLGVDQVTLDSENNESGNENYKLGVGKYINDRVYVEIQRSSDPAEPWQGQVQIELAPNVSLETSAQSNTGVSGIDIKWKRDY